LGDPLRLRWHCIQGVERYADVADWRCGCWGPAQGWWDGGVCDVGGGGQEEEVAVGVGRVDDAVVGTGCVAGCGGRLVAGCEVFYADGGDAGETGGVLDVLSWGWERGEKGLTRRCNCRRCLRCLCSG